MDEKSIIVVMTHNPLGEYGDVRPQIEKDFGYKNWKKSINVHIGQIVLIYISGNNRRIEYIMEVENVYDDSMDLKLIDKISEKKANELKLKNLQENGFRNGTVNYILNNNINLYNYVLSILNENDDLQKEKGNKMNIKNIILYGAPGVGKTHNYKKLISLIEQGKSQSEIFNSIQANEKFTDEDESFQNVKNEKRVEFVTFHQSFSYEDFIEGFRPQESGKIEIEKGVFRLISKKAYENKELSIKSEEEISNKIKFEKELESFKENLEEEIEKKGFYTITDSAYLTGYDNESFKYNIRRENPTYKYDLRMKFEDLIKFSENNVSSRQDVKNLENINSLANQHASYYFKVYQEIIKNRVNISNDRFENISEKNFYLVIDEINRGNISKIFGELITLIEESKRDTYEVTLPYSKQKFSVPSNLFIIGTMNTTDKSIALIDVALRRRFTFIKMQPNSDLVLDSFKSKFEALNKLIIKHIGEDYQIGHSYFMNITDSDLDFVLKYKIKPLLEEYYYGDDRISEALKIIGLEKE